tara:strand:- start:42 stop:755 length:714 start_codon:yes stop_codon:yes gene_type:complete
MAYTRGGEAGKGTTFKSGEPLPEGELDEIPQHRGTGPTTPAANYKVGDGSIRDLLLYILGEDKQVKKLEPKKKQKAITKEFEKDFTRDVITTVIRGSIEEDASNPFVKQHELRDTEEESTVEEPETDTSFMGEIVPPPDEVTMENIPVEKDRGFLPSDPRETMSPDELSLHAELEEASARGERGQVTTRLGMPPEESRYTRRGQGGQGVGLRSRRYKHGGKVNKKFNTGGKVQSYNY